MSKRFLSRQYSYYLLLFIVLVLSSIIFFLRLSDAQIEIWDEQTNISVVNENSSSENKLLLTLEGEPFFEKPPLWYYLATLTVEASEGNLAVYRSISALAGIVTTLLIYMLLNKRIGIMHAFLAAISFLAIGQVVIPNLAGFFSSHSFRTADLDALQIMFMMLFVFAISKLKDSPRYLYLMSITLGLGFMAKGPVVFLLLIALVIYLFYSRLISISDLSLVRIESELVKHFSITRKQTLIALALFSLIVIPWHLYMIAQFGLEFIAKYFFYHVLSRSTQALEGHNAPFYYYLKVFFNFSQVLIWPILAASVVSALRIRKKDFLLSFSLIFLTLYTLFLFLVQTRLAWYLLPIYPFLAILVGYLSASLWSCHYSRQIKVLLSLLIWIPIIASIALNMSLIN